MLPPAIEIHNAHLQFADQILFDGLHCYLPAGKTTCLLGRSGIGKTTLLRLLAGFTHNSAYHSAQVITSDNKSLSHRISYMAQTDLLMPWLTVLENILLGYRLRQTVKYCTSQKQDQLDLHKKAHRLLNKAGLTDASQKYPAQLSGGMRQRVALVRTLIEDRPVILMDEPFSALDTLTRLNLQTLAAELLVDRTVLLITHDPLEALRLGHQILIMSGQPAKLEKLELTGNPPRSLNDEKLLHWQAELMEKLLRKGSDSNGKK